MTTDKQLRFLFFKKYGRFAEQQRDPNLRKEETQVANLIKANTRDEQAVTSFKKGDIGIASLIAQRKQNQRDRKISQRALMRLKPNPTMSERQLRAL